MRSRFVFIIIVLLIETPLVWSQGTLAWHFDSTHFTVQPTDQVLLTATVTNSSDQPYTIPGGGAVFAGHLQSLYNFSWQIDLFDKTVPSYGTLQFAFGTLTPIGGHVPPGIYHADPAAIDFTELDLLYSDNTFDITVVPEPKPLALGVVGLACLCALVGPRHRQLDCRRTSGLEWTPR